MKFDVFRIPLDLPLLLSASKIRPISALSKEHSRAPKSAEVAKYLKKILRLMKKNASLPRVDVVSSDAMPSGFEETNELDSGPDQALERDQMVTQLADAIELLPEEPEWYWLYTIKRK